jgi:hypothetical protein
LNVYRVWPIAKLLHKVANNPSRSVLIKNLINNQSTSAD